MAMAATAAPAPALATAAGARDATRLEPLVCFYYYYYTNVYLGSLNLCRNGDGTSSSGRGSRRDTSRVAGTFLFYFLFISLMFILSPLSASKRRWQQQGLEA